MSATGSAETRWRCFELIDIGAPMPRTTCGQDNITGRFYLEKGAPVTVLVRWSGRGPRNVLIQREDGSRVVRPFRGLRKPSERAT